MKVTINDIKLGKQIVVFKRCMIRSPYIPNHSLLEVKVNSANADLLVKVEFVEFLLSSGNGVVEEVELLKLGGT